MKKSVMQKWVKALRSGKYTQAPGTLKAETGAMCCLGVLCDVSGLGRWRGSDYHTRGGGEAASCWLSPSVQKWAGMNSDVGRVDLPNGSVNLMTLNDDRGRSFKRIAAFIERNYKKL